MFPPPPDAEHQGSGQQPDAVPLPGEAAAEVRPRPPGLAGGPRSRHKVCRPVCQSCGGGD